MKSWTQAFLNFQTLFFIWLCSSCNSCLHGQQETADVSWPAERTLQSLTEDGRLFFAENEVLNQPAFGLQILPELDLPNDTRVAKLLVDPSDESELTDQQKNRKRLLNRCLSTYYTKQVDANVLRPWSVMHGLIGFGQATQVQFGGKPYSSVKYLCANGIGDDRRLLYVSNGRLKTHVGPGYQGHEGQLLAMLAQVGVGIDEPLYVDGRRFTVKDLVEYEKRTCRADRELTFKLIGISYYADSQESWRSDNGENWSVSRIVKEELKQPVSEGACGGTHRLMSLSFACRERLMAGFPLDGQWARAHKFIQDFQEYTWHFHNPNGSFSTAWFKKREAKKNAKVQLYTTGHVLEWLVFSLPDDQLQDQRVTKTVDFVLNLMMAAPNYDLDVGPRGHALHALRMYEERVFGKSDYGQLLDNVAQADPPKQTGPDLSRPRVENARFSTPSNNPYPYPVRRGLFGRRR